jgi:hypothetical protein
VTTDQESADGLIPKGAQVFHAGEWVEMPTWYSAKEIYNSYDFRLIGFCRTHDGLGLGGVEIFAGHGVDTTNLEYSVQILGEEPSSYWKSNNLWKYTAYGDLGTGIVNSDFGPEFGRSVLRFQTNNDSQPNVVRFILKIASKGSDQELKDFYDVVVRRSSSREKLIQLKLTRNKCTFDVAVMGTFTDESFESFKSGN